MSLIEAISITPFLDAALNSFNRSLQRCIRLLVKSASPLRLLFGTSGYFVSRNSNSSFSKRSDILYRNIEQIFLCRRVNDDDLILYGHRLILRLLQDLLDTFALCQTVPSYHRPAQNRTGRRLPAHGTVPARHGSGAAIFFIALICAAPPTRDTESPALTAGRKPALNISVSR